MNVYYPTKDDIVKWAYGSDKSWPASDWDYYVLDPAHDDLIFDLANEPNCPNRRFFVHALYYLVGSAFNKKSPPADTIARIQRLLSRVDVASLPDVVTWRGRAEQLLKAEIPFDVEMWLHHLFNEETPG
jgi:hypothetical protein